MIVTIDGPAGSGKSSAARELARRLGFEVLDTGAMFRAVALAVVEAGIQESNLAAIEGLLSRLTIDMPPGRVLLNGRDVTEQIRSPGVSQGASRVAAIHAVRRYLAGQQRAISAGRNMVCEGRDQGTAVFPDASCKFFLEANRGERARRRWLELQGQNSALSLDQVLAEQDERDRRDAGRDLAPMIPAPDAIIVDTTHLTAQQVVDRLETEVRRCRSTG